MALTQTLEAGLKISNAPGNGKFLQYKDSTDKLTWADVSQSGGATGLDLNDDVKIRFGTGNDAYIGYDITGDTSNTLMIRCPDSDIHVRADNWMLISDDTGGRAIYLDDGNDRLELGHDGVDDAYFNGGSITLLRDVTLNAQKDLRFADSDSSNYVALQAPATISSNYTLTLPTADGSSGQAIVTDGSGNLSFSAAGASLTGSTNNTVVTVTGANAMQGEANLTFDGTELTLAADRSNTAGTGHISIAPGDTTSIWTIRHDQTGNDLWFDRGTSSSSTAYIGFSADGNIKVTAGKGIDFSAQTATSATGASASSEVLDHYEEGTWTPVFGASSTAPTYSNWNTTGTYVRVGGVVHIWYDPVKVTFSGTASAGYGEITGFPFATTDNGSMACGKCADILSWSSTGNRGDRGFSLYAAGAGGTFNTDAPSTGFTWDNGNASGFGYFDLGGSYRCT